jgi:hypothetical protein
VRITNIEVTRCILSQNSRTMKSRTSQTGAYYLKPLFTPQGGRILTGGGGIDREGNYVQATIVEIASDAECVKEELFAPVLYVMRFQTLEEAIELNNSVPQGLSSSIFTTNPETIFKWTGYEFCFLVSFWG